MWRCHRWCHSMSHADRRFWATEIRCAGNRPSVEAINSPEKIQYTLATRWCVNPHARLSYIDMHIPTKSYNYTQHINLSYINLIYIYIYIYTYIYYTYMTRRMCWYAQLQHTLSEVYSSERSELSRRRSCGKSPGVEWQGGPQMS